MFLTLKKQQKKNRTSRALCAMLFDGCYNRDHFTRNDFPTIPSKYREPQHDCYVKINVKIGCAIKGQWYLYQVENKCLIMHHFL